LKRKGSVRVNLTDHQAQHLLQVLDFYRKQVDTLVNRAKGEEAKKKYLGWIDIAIEITDLIKDAQQRIPESLKVR
jgi:hypothetical protein